MDLNKLEREILALITRRGSVSFVELARKIDGFVGDLEYVSDFCDNIFFWAGISPAGMDALERLKKLGLIEGLPASMLTYVADGSVLDMPIVTARRKYTEPHWLPIVFTASKHGKNRAA